MTTDLTRRTMDQGEVEEPEPVELPSFRKALDQTPLYANEHASGEEARKLMQFHRELREAEGVTLEDVKACDLGSPERAILLENYARNNLHKFIDTPPPEHQSKPLHLEVEPEVAPETSYHEEMHEVKAAPMSDRVRLLAAIVQKRMVGGGSGR